MLFRVITYCTLEYHYSVHKAERSVSSLVILYKRNSLFDAIQRIHALTYNFIADFFSKRRILHFLILNQFLIDPFFI